MRWSPRVSALSRAQNPAGVAEPSWPEASRSELEYARKPAGRSGEYRSCSRRPLCQNPRVPTLYLMVGLPGAGKTTRARQLAVQHRALRLTPDEWMIPLFGDNDANGKRNVLEGRLLWLALEALRVGTDVVLDYGCWARVERFAIRWMVESVGASYQLVYLPVDQATQRARIAYRQENTPDQTFPMSEAELTRWRKQFEEPDAAELSHAKIGEPPSGWPGWRQWAADYWPSVMQPDPSA